MCVAANTTVYQREPVSTFENLLDAARVAMTHPANNAHFHGCNVTQTLRRSDGALQCGTDGLQGTVFAKDSLPFVPANPSQVA